MSWSRTIRGAERHKAEPRQREPGRPFPNAATMFGLAAAMLLVWLLSTWLPQFLSASDRATPATNIEAGASK